MNKKITLNLTKFSHELNETSFELIEAADKNVLILSIKRNKDHITTALTKADLHLVMEFLKLRGVE